MICLGKQLVENPSADAIRMVTRSEWLAQEPENELTPLRLPATRVIIAHTATESCSSQGSCVFRGSIHSKFSYRKPWMG